jgi:hypothetical protein
MAATSIAGDWKNIKLYYSRYVYTNTNYVIISNCLAELLTISLIFKSEFHNIRYTDNACFDGCSLNLTQESNGQ